MRIFRKIIREKKNVPGSMLVLPGILLCIVSLTGCAMTPRFVTAKELLARSRSMQEALTETVPEDEGTAAESLSGDAFPESVSEGSGGDEGGFSTAEEAGEILFRPVRKRNSRTKQRRYHPLPVRQM